jgi:cytochrome c biogenesis protein CcmG/thiol:disulfide interchange protein DsbE
MGSAHDDRSVHIGALAIGALVFASFVGIPQLRRLGTKEHGARAAPGFVLPVIHGGDDGALLALADLKGQPVVLDFWATWCGPCVMQTPILDRVAKRHDGRGLRVVGVDVHDDDTLAARRFAAQKALSYPIVKDGSGLIQREYGVTRLPSLVFIGRDGRIAKVTTGVVDEATLDRLVREIL